MDFNILIAGSKDFKDTMVVASLLEMLSQNFNVQTVTVSKFAGACEIAQEWVKIKNEHLPDNKKIKLKFFSLDNVLQEHNNTLFEQIDLPELVIKNSPLFQKGKEALMEQGITTVVAFPNKEGKLGAATQNIVRFAQLAKIGVFPVDKLLEQLNNKAQKTATKKNKP